MCVVKVNLGDCNVQTQRSTVVRINNCSDLTAFLAVKYVSKCVTANVRDMVIAPRQAYDLLLSYVPRKVNPEYEKQITIVNLRNRKNDTVFILRANVIDRNRVSIHALYYKILAPTPTNEIDMGMTVEGYPAINCFDVRLLFPTPNAGFETIRQQNSTQRKNPEPREKGRKCSPDEND